MREYVRTDKNGTKIYQDYTCPRCGGTGKLVWFSHVYNGDCFKCNGSGTLVKPVVYKEYTDEYIAKRNAKRVAETEAKRAESLKHIDAEKEKKGFICEDGEWVIYRVVGKTYEIKDLLKSLGAHFNIYVNWYFNKPINSDKFRVQRMVFDDVAEVKFIGTDACVVFKDNIDTNKFLENIEKKEALEKVAKTSAHVGNVGDKIDFVGTAKCVGTWETSVNWMTLSMSKYVITDANGNQYVWTTSSGYLDEDKELHIKAIIKDHTEYKGIKQTVIKNCRVI